MVSVVQRGRRHNSTFNVDSVIFEVVPDFRRSMVEEIQSRRRKSREKCSPRPVICRRPVSAGNVGDR